MKKGMSIALTADQEKFSFEALMGMGLPDDRRKADSSYRAKTLGAWLWWELFEDPPASKSCLATFGLKRWRVR
jgi:hypothetical protein